MLCCILTKRFFPAAFSTRCYALLICLCKAVASKRKADDAPKARRQSKKPAVVKTEPTAPSLAGAPNASVDDNDDVDDDDAFGLLIDPSSVDLDEGGGAMGESGVAAAAASVGEDVFAGLDASAGVASGGGGGDDDDDDYD
jgi:hypothetical protein